MEKVSPEYQAISVKGVTTLQQAGLFTIRVFAQVQSLFTQSMASQGEDVGCCYANVEDACETGCNAACKRAVTHSANSQGSIYQDCSEACFKACVRPDAPLGKFSTTLVKVDN